MVVVELGQSESIRLHVEEVTIIRTLPPGDLYEGRVTW